MTAILKHELKSYFHSLTAYVFGAGLLLAVGLGAMLFNIEQAVSNFPHRQSGLCRRHRNRGNSAELFQRQPVGVRLRHRLWLGGGPVRHRFGTGSGH